MGYRFLQLSILAWFTSSYLLGAERVYLEVKCRGASSLDAAGFLIADEDAIKISEGYILIQYKGTAKRVNTKLDPLRPQCRDYYIDVTKHCKSGAPPKCYSIKTKVNRFWNILEVGTTEATSGLLSCEIGSQVRRFPSRESWLKGFASNTAVDWVDQPLSKVSSIECVDVVE